MSGVEIVERRSGGRARAVRIGEVPPPGWMRPSRSERNPSYSPKGLPQHDNHARGGRPFRPAALRPSMALPACLGPP